MLNEAFMVVSKCFTSLSADSWKEIVSSEWDSFLDTLDSNLSDGEEKRRVLEVLSNPPRYEEIHSFEARHFTGGLPDSAMPVESLYIEDPKNRVPQYLREPALYMKDLIQSLGYEVPNGYETYPDHIALELEVLALLMESDINAARDFATTRFGWTSKLKDKLKGFGDESLFYVALLDALEALIRSM